MADITDVRLYVLNLARRPDRRERIHATLPPGLPAIFTTDWPGPFDCLRLDRPTLDSLGIDLFPWQIESDDADWSRPLKVGEIGCTLHHVAAWRDAAHEGAEPYIVIVEDDVVFAPDFRDRLLAALTRLEAEGPVFDLLYLGRIHYEPAEDRPVSAGFVRPGLSYGTHGYLLRRTALPILLAMDLEKAVIPIDEFLPCMYLDHPRPDLWERFPMQLRALACVPVIIGDPPRGDSDIHWSAPFESCTR